MELEWLIKYESEATTLDFKREQYLKPKYAEFIKDIISMANTPIRKKKYIIVGVKESSSGDKEYFPIRKEDFVDKATYQQIIRENVEPYIEVDYYSLVVDGNLLGIFEIGDCDNPPYMVKKKYGDKLNQGDMFIRKGSQKDRVSRSELDEILSFRQKELFSNYIRIGINKEMQQTMRVYIDKNYEESPSNKVKNEITNILEYRRSPMYNPTMEKMEQTFNMSIPIFGFGYNKPFSQRTTEELEKMLSTVNTDYHEEELYYLSEFKSVRLNVYITNDSDKYIEDANIILKIPRHNRKIFVFDTIPEKPNDMNRMLQSLSASSIKLDYPSVEKNNDYYTVEWHYGNLPHKKIIEFFNEELRLCVSPNFKEKNILIDCELYGKNLPSPIYTKLELQISWC